MQFWVSTSKVDINFLPSQCASLIPICDSQFWCFWDCSLLEVCWTSGLQDLQGMLRTSEIMQQILLMLHRKKMKAVKVKPPLINFSLTAKNKSERLTRSNLDSCRNYSKHNIDVKSHKNYVRRIKDLRQ